MVQHRRSNFAKASSGGENVYSVSSVKVIQYDIQSYEGPSPPRAVTDNTQMKID